MGPVPSLADNDFFSSEFLTFEEYARKIIEQRDEKEKRAELVSCSGPSVIGKPSHSKQPKRKEAFRRKR